jgi:uncharacterized protein with von Willebrand factor type A (vWA) domain
VYDDQVAKADAEALAALEMLKSRAMKAEDLDAANAIQAQINDLKKHAAEISGGREPSKTNAIAGSKFFGVGGSGRKIIYLCDKSGSMLSVFGVLKAQLMESVSNLRGDQQFNIVFFSDEGADPLFKDFSVATPIAVSQAKDFVSKQLASGGTLPLPAIQFSLKQKPDVLYVLTDGFDQIPSFDPVVKAFKQGNADGKTQVNCIFLQSDEDPKLEAFLKQIAGDGHGTFKKILKSDM